MIYTDLTRKALKLSFEAHKRQEDKSGVPYVFHPYEVASHMKDESSVCVALLHDVVEDTEVTIEDLRKQGFPQEVCEAVRVMTRESGVPYLDYVNEIKVNRIARRVKMADLQHNMDATRMTEISDGHREKMKLYEQAYRILSECDEKADD